MHFRRHGRFYVALAVGAIVLAILHGLKPWALRGLLAGNAFFLVYLVLTAGFLARGTPEQLRRNAATEDEGLPLILLVTATAIALSLAAIFLLLRAGTAETPAGALAVAGVPLGWLTLHTLAAFHYANMYYAPRPGGGDRAGLDFPGTEEPGPWDFLYFAFVIGIAAQVSDVAVRSTPLRRVALAHGITSFFYNTVILALVVNAVLDFAG